jgi:hypothetical protein
MGSRISIVAQVLLGVGALVLLGAMVAPWYEYTAEISGDSAVEIATAAQTENLVQASLVKALLAVAGGGLCVSALAVLAQSKRFALGVAVAGAILATGAVVWGIADKPAGPDDAQGLDRDFQTIDIQLETSLRVGAYLGVAGAVLLVAGAAGLGAARPPE